MTDPSITANDVAAATGQPVAAVQTAAAGPIAIAVIGAGGKMGMRVSNNLAKTPHRVAYVENSETGRKRTIDAGRDLTEPPIAVADADIVVFAVPDLALSTVTAELVPLMKPGSIALTLDPAAAYAGLLADRDDVVRAVTHPCHPSIFLERTTPEEYADTFGGIAAPQDAIAAIESDDPDLRAVLDATVRAIFSPVIDVHYVTIKQLAQLEPTLVETVACMIGSLLNEALSEAVNTMGVPEAAARSILYGHTQVALANGLRGDNPFSDACLIAMEFGRDRIIKEDWKRIFRDDELDENLAGMLHLDKIDR
jgi:D-apionate oxidoisomerase